VAAEFLLPRTAPVAAAGLPRPAAARAAAPYRTRTHSSWMCRKWIRSKYPV
jgi:hypothetical protein